MNTKQTFEFLNSPLWLKHTHESYRTPDEIRYRSKEAGLNSKQWEETKNTIIGLRKTNAIPLFFKTLDKKFWFFLSDCINRKSQELENKGRLLHQKIVQQINFKEDFLTDATIEEAITSAIYEGANSTRSKAKELITSGSHPKNKDEWMLVNNYEAMRWIKANKHREVTAEMIGELHAIVSRNTLDGDDANFIGKFRNDAVYVRSRAGDIKHEGIEHTAIDSALKEAIALTCKNVRFFPPAIKGILLHYFIAYVHPFFDGNGRTARALFYFMAMKSNLSFIELLSISAYLKTHGPQYEKSFTKVVGNELDITYFIDFNLDALLHAVTEVERKVDYLLSIRAIRGKYPQISDNQIGLIQRLALNQFRKVSADEYAGEISMSREMARQELRQLVEWGFVTEEKSGKKFVFHIIRDHLERILQAAGTGRR